MCVSVCVCVRVRVRVYVRVLACVRVRTWAPSVCKMSETYLRINDVMLLVLFHVFLRSSFISISENVNISPP